jgi:hypothetical protein
MNTSSTARKNLLSEIGNGDPYLIKYPNFRELMTLFIEKHPVPRALKSGQSRRIKDPWLIESQLEQLILFKELGFPITESEDAQTGKRLASEIVASIWNANPHTLAKMYQRERDSNHFNIANYHAEQKIEWLYANTELSDDHMRDQEATLDILRSHYQTLGLQKRD